MALFPAFADSSSSEKHPTRQELDWLSNKSFCTEDALSLHQRTLQSALSPQPASHSPSRSPLQPGLSEESGTDSRSTKKKKKKKKKKQKKKHKKKRDYEEDEEGNTSDSDSSPEIRESTATERVARQDTCVVLPGRGIWLDEAQSVTEETFRIDKKSDPANWEYKSLYRGDIARYKRKGNSCLGINPKKQQIIWQDTLSKKKQPQRKIERYFTKSTVQLLRAKADFVSCKESASRNAGDFIPVLDPDMDGVVSSSGPISWVNPLGVYDSSTALWLEGKGGPEYETIQPVPRDNNILAKVEDYNKRLRECPSDIQLWMEFVSFQDELVKQPSMYSTSKGELESHRTSVKLLLEKKLAILERSIESNPGSTELKLAKLKLCEEFWEAPALLKEWQKLIFLHPNDSQLWQKYLLFCQGQFSTFSVSKMNGVYGKCLSTLAAVQDGSMLSHNALPDTDRQMYDIFLQQCQFLRQAGHTEKAISLFQALTDFTFYKPDTVKHMTTKEQVDFFEPFWDSGEPRFGEKGAKGWSSWMRQQERGGWVTINNLVGDDEDEADEEFNIKDKTCPRYKIWLDIEYSREARHWLPWHPDPTKKQTEDDCEDPERQVLFDDIGPSMFKIDSPQLQFQLLQSFLHFVGVPCGAHLSLYCFYLFLDETSIFDHVSPYERLLTSFEIPLSGIGTVGHLDTISRSRQQIGHFKEGETFIQNIFQSALSLLQGEEKRKLSVWWLRYEISKVVWWLQAKNKKKLKSQGKRSKRLAKGLLKESSNRNSLALWKEYALLEWLLGNIDDARKVFDTAISLAGSKGLKDQELCSLCLLYSELEGKILDNPEQNAGSRAVHILTSLTESSPYIPYSSPEHAVSILKARKVYEHALQDCLMQEPHWGRVSLSGCFALFQYLTVSVDAAVAVLRQAADSQLIPETPYNIERNSDCPLQAITLMHTNLLRHHYKASVYPLRPLRETLMSALKLYPTNVSLWKSYIMTESKLHNASKVRRFIDSIRRVTSALEPCLFAIRAEEDRRKLVDSVQRAELGEVHSIFPETGLSNRIKALFEHALQSEYGSRCPLLWRQYLYFMVSIKERSKGLFYKAIQSCPWAKALYLDAVEYFPEQLQETIDLMTEKELRVRVPLEELDLLLED
ncbi:NRDE-2, necessary for RNA interference, domain containing L homeolog [Xenopus laevis]|uniref:MGC83828 protein n=1 Tax=Xenopus laevis TaxID=8355 RepID=Q6IRN3_XENLA|nr:NRDE-2, necessary for RNA interference, domain containing L homeolog [Xenopus laevis]AAH70786.1 MGC83828 protein [Xenopus laevis]